MDEIRIDSEKLTRIVAQVLRDDFKMLPDVANRASIVIEGRLKASVVTPDNRGSEYGVIPAVSNQALEEHRVCKACGGLFDGRRVRF